jgi:hypothetical protein
MAVIASFSSKVAKPKDAGLGAPVLVVGVVGGTSWLSVRFAVRMTVACPLVPAISGSNRERTVVCARSMTGRPPIIQSVNEFVVPFNTVWAI